MIRGNVNVWLEAVVQIRVRGPSGSELALNAIVDSGCNAPMVLPPSTVAALGLIRQSVGTGMLADGTIQRFETFAAEVEWGGVWRTVLVSCVGNQPMVGMQLLVGHEIRIAVKPGGAVEINALP